MKRIVIRLGLPALLCCVGCDRAAENPRVADEGRTIAPASGVDAPDPVAPAGIASSGLSAGYLAGPWCFLYYETAGLYDEAGERSEERIDYVFREDGTLLYQINPRTPVDQKGTWKVDGETLSIGPVIRMITTDVHSVDKDRFVLGKSTHVVFERGTCAREVAP